MFCKLLLILLYCYEYMYARTYVQYSSAHLQGNVSSCVTREFLASHSQVACALPLSVPCVTVESNALNHGCIEQPLIIFKILEICLATIYP